MVKDTTGQFYYSEVEPFKSIINHFSAFVLFDRQSEIDQEDLILGSL